MKARYPALTCAAALTQSLAFAGFFGPSNYDDCVLSSMKGVTSDVAARAIMRSCREKFSEKIPTSVPVPSEVLSAITGRALVVDYLGPNFTGDIYNGTNNWILTSITVRLIPRVNGKEGPQSRGRDFLIPITVLPLSSKAFYHPIGSIGSRDWNEVDWMLLSAQGYLSRGQRPSARPCCRSSCSAPARLSW